MTETTLGARIKQALRGVGLTQRAACKKIGISEQAMTNYMKDQIPKAAILHKIARITGRSMEWLLTGVEPAEGLPGSVVSYARESQKIYTPPAKDVDISEDEEIRAIVEEVSNNPALRKNLYRILRLKKESSEAIVEFLSALRAKSKLDQ